MTELRPITEGTRVIWQPLPGSQRTVLSHAFVFEILYHGNRGPGKSDTLLMDFAQHVGLGYGADWRGVIFRQTYKQLQDLIAKSRRWFKLIFPTAVYNKSDFSWTFETGEILYLRHFDKEDDYWNYHGHEYPFIGWDELTNWNSLNGYKRMISCCRSSNPNVPRKIRATTNPYGVGHNAVKHYFELPGKDGVMRRRTYEFEDPITGDIKTEKLIRLAVRGQLKENTILLKAQPNYIAQLKLAARNDAELKAWVEGSWDIVAGGMFDDVWDQKTNVIPRMLIPRQWPIYRSFDWGSSKPFSVGWWTVADGSDFYCVDGTIRSSINGDIIRVAEWYGWTGEPNEGTRSLSAEITKGIKERELGLFPNHKVIPGPADNSIFDVVDGKSIAAAMGKEVRLSNGNVVPGVVWTRSNKAPGSRVNGWDNMRTLIRNARRGDGGEPRENKGLFVCANCDNFMRTVPVLPRCDKNLDDVNSDSEDHIGDETRYFISFIDNGVRGGKTRGLH